MSKKFWNVMAIIFTFCALLGAGVLLSHLVIFVWHWDKMALLLPLGILGFLFCVERHDDAQEKENKELSDMLNRFEQQWEDEDEVKERLRRPWDRK